MLKMWGDAVRYLKESRRFVYFVAGMYVIFFFIGVVFFFQFGFFDNNFFNLKSKVLGFSFLEFVFFVIVNNSLSAIAGIVSGILIGIPPLLVTIYQGLFFGFANVLSYVTHGSLGEVMFRGWPHSIFELPAFFISWGLGIKLGFALLKDRKKFGESFKKSIWVYLLVVLPLLVIAAVIEGIVFLML
jgi:stage II sporulation protein M